MNLLVRDTPGQIRELLELGESLREVCERVRAAGADSVAMLGALVRAADVTAATRAVLDRIASPR